MPEVRAMSMDSTLREGLYGRWARLRSSLEQNPAAFQEPSSHASAGLAALFEKWWHEIEAEYGSPTRR